MQTDVCTHLLHVHVLTYPVSLTQYKGHGDRHPPNPTLTETLRHCVLVRVSYKRTDRGFLSHCRALPKTTHYDLDGESVLSVYA